MRYPPTPRWRSRGRLWLALGGLAAGGMASAQEAVPLDRLLKLPDGAGSASVETRAGSSRGEWLERFEQARRDLEAARAALEATRAQIEDKAGGESAWRMGAPGIGGSDASAGDAPLDYKLTQELRRNREEVERAERRLQDLEVEANLAGVPSDWRGQAAAANSPSGAAAR